MNMFTNDIEELYKIIISKKDIDFKNLALTNFVLKFEISSKISEFFYKNFHDRKTVKGVVYTPINISNYMINNTITKEEIISNPYLKICDLACGTGNILIPLYNHLLNIFEENINEINCKNSMEITDIKAHILKNNLFGYDIDSFALKLLTIDLFKEHGVIFRNLYNEDFLTCDKDDYDVFIGNPPYIGHKDINKEYSKALKLKFKSIYSDKGDISYCFFQEALNHLEDSGKLTFITSRYFLESPSGSILRRMLKVNFDILKIVDFYGIRPFSNANVDPVIVFLSKEQANYQYQRNIEVIKPQNCCKKEFLEELFSKDSYENNKLNIFYINKTLLDDKGWILIDQKQRSIIEKIKAKCSTTLDDICISYQGIITGCDKAFIVTKEDIAIYHLEEELLMPWIKSSNIEKASVTNTDKYIIYSDLINNESDFPNCISFINQMKYKLEERRECKNGIRKWFQLQWGRKPEIFSQEKIIYPYKSVNNRFALSSGSYFSADVYALVLRDHVSVTYEYIMKLLNSDIYEFYFKTFGKKLGDKLYEYYPSNLLKLEIPIDAINSSADLYDFFGFTSDEIDIIKNI